jgi:hypothetical protein
VSNLTIPSSPSKPDIDHATAAVYTSDAMQVNALGAMVVVYTSDVLGHIPLAIVATYVFGIDQKLDLRRSDANRNPEIIRRSSQVYLYADGNQEQ